MEINEDILIRYIDGMLTEEEAVEVKNWRAASLENEKLLEQVYFTAQVASRLKVMRTVNPDEALSRFKSRIHKKEKRLALRQVLGVIQRAAAVLFIPVFLLSAYLFIQQGQGNVRTLAVRTNPGVVSAFDLPDGSKVWLNANSELRYPSDFNADTRTVELTGQGYFEVTKNAHKPFIVKADKDYSVEVLGTSFNVQDYPENKDIVVCLDEGNINLTLPTEKKYPVQPGERLVYNKDNQQCTISKMNDMQRLSMWKQNVIVFKDTPLPEVIKILNRWYNVEFKVEDENVLKYVYTLTSDNTLLEKVLMDLEKIAPVKFEYNEDKKEVIVKMK